MLAIPFFVVISINELLSQSINGLLREIAEIVAKPYGAIIVIDQLYLEVQNDTSLLFLNISKTTKIDVELAHSLNLWAVQNTTHLAFL